MGKLTSKMTDLSPDTPFTNDIERAQTLYFNWLCDMVHVDNYCGESWYILAKLLHNIEFYWTLPNDENQAIHGAKLRTVWLENMEEQAEDLGVGHPMFPKDALDGPCTVLEMLVGLAVSIESEVMLNSDKGNRTAVWFWEMIGNLMLAESTEKYFLHEFADYCIDENKRDAFVKAVTDCLDRDLAPNGWGGLFPLKSTDEDQRYVELWYQAQKWLEENYPDEFYH